MTTNPDRKRPEFARCYKGSPKDPGARAAVLRKVGLMPKRKTDFQKD